MYSEYYGLIKKPFENTPDPDFLFLSKNHREVLASLSYSINAAKGFVLVVGDIGTGKTTLIQALIKQLDASFILLNITNPRATFNDMLHYLGKKIDISAEQASTLETVEAIRNKLETLHENAGKHAVLIVDEAHLLSDEALEDIRLISNIENEARKLIHIVLVGQNELSNKLLKESLRPLQQRLGVTRRLVPLSRKETEEYILHRLRIAGKGLQLFDKKALALIWKKSRGIPRLINQICDNAMLIGYAVAARSIGGKIIKEVISDMESVHNVKRHGPVFPIHRLKWIGAVAVAALLVVYLGICLLDGMHFSSKDGISTKYPVPARPETPVQAEKGPQNIAAPAKDVFPIEKDIFSRQAASAPPSEGTETPSADTLHASEKKQTTAGNKPPGIEQQAVETEKNDAGKEVQDRAKKSNISDPKHSPNHVDGSAVDTLHASEMKHSTEESQPSGIEQRSAAITEKSAAEKSKTATAQNNNSVVLPQKTAHVNRPALSKTVGDRAVDVDIKKQGDTRTKVRLNECLYALARRTYGVGNESIIDLIQMANPGIRDVNHIYPGQEIILPHIERKDLIVKDEKGAFRIHYGSFIRRNDARLCTQDLIEEDKKAATISARQGDNRRYRVYVGAFKDREDAEKLLDILQLKYFYFLGK